VVEGTYGRALAFFLFLIAREYIAESRLHETSQPMYPFDRRVPCSLFVATVSCHLQVPLPNLLTLSAATPLPSAGPAQHPRRRPSTTHAS
jgi:hypothetical protein